MIRNRPCRRVVEDRDRRGILVRVDSGNTVLVRQHRSCLRGLSWGAAQAGGVGRSGLSRGRLSSSQAPRACAHAASPTLRIKDSLVASIAFRVRAGRLERRPGKQRPDRPLDPNTQMVFVSRHRDRLADGFRFVVPDADLVAAMEDKARFARLAAAHGLPVPPTVVLDPRLPDPPDELFALGLPVVVKPTVRDASWARAAGSKTKALRLETVAELRDLWPRLAGLSGVAVAQQSIPGPETAVVSHHVYVDEAGEVAAEFTGRKIRTIPVEYGHTSSLTILDDPEVARLGRQVCRELDLRGVAKLDFKYAPDGRLYLFEINSRLTLW